VYLLERVSDDKVLAYWTFTGTNTGSLFGGLVVGDRVGPISKDADYIRRNAPSAERASGRRFGAPHWRGLVEVGTWVHDSGPPVRAVVATRDLAGDVAAIDVHQALCDGMFVLASPLMIRPRSTP